MYVSFVSRKYTYATVIFNGYCSGPGTKDTTNLHRTKGVVGRSVSFKPDMVVCDKKDIFLSNLKNKQEFLYLLGDEFEMKGIRTKHAKGDADCLIIKEALHAASLSPTVVIGEDTDLLVLLLHHVTSQMNTVYFTSGTLKKQQVKLWNIQESQA